MKRTYLSVRVLVLVTMLSPAGCDEPDPQAQKPVAEMTAEEFAAHCQNTAEEVSCSSTEDWQDPDSERIMRCIWTEWVETSLDPESGACVYGAQEGRCEVANYGTEGCGFWPAVGCADAQPGVPLYRNDGGGPPLIAAPAVCNPVANDVSICVQSDNWTLPECACLCDEAFPGG